jgi:hypothetical protein
MISRFKKFKLGSYRENVLRYIRHYITVIVRRTPILTNLHGFLVRIQQLVQGVL